MKPWSAELQTYFLRPMLNAYIGKHTWFRWFISDIADFITILFLNVFLFSPGRQLTLETLYPLTSNTKLLKEALNKGALIYLLDLYCNATNPNVREQTAELFAKVLSDKLVGPKVRIIMAKFLPAIFMDAMRDSAEASVHMFEGHLLILFKAYKT